MHFSRSSAGSAGCTTKGATAWQSYKIQNSIWLSKKQQWRSTKYRQNRTSSLSPCWWKSSAWKSRCATVVIVFKVPQRKTDGYKPWLIRCTVNRVVQRLQLSRITARTFCYAFGHIKELSMQNEKCFCGCESFYVRKSSHRWKFVCAACKCERVICSPGVRVREYEISPAFNA